MYNYPRTSQENQEKYGKRTTADWRPHRDPPSGPRVTFTVQETKGNDVDDIPFPTISRHTADFSFTDLILFFFDFFFFLRLATRE